MSGLVIYTCIRQPTTRYEWAGNIHLYTSTHHTVWVGWWHTLLYVNPPHGMSGVLTYTNVNPPHCMSGLVTYTCIRQPTTLHESAGGTYTYLHQLRKCGDKSKHPANLKANKQPSIRLKSFSTFYSCSEGKKGMSYIICIRLY